MLEFAARDYLEIAHLFGAVSARLRKEQPYEKDLGKAIEKLIEETNRLGLYVTREALGELLLEMIKVNPASAMISGEGDDRTLHLATASFPDERICHHVEAIYSTLKAELRATLLKVIPEERRKYDGGEWLRNSIVQSKFPISFKELTQGGNCYCLDQPTACVFHSMRALEPGLSALATSFNVSTLHDNWQNIIEQIESKVRTIGAQPKTQQKIDDEKFFGAAASHLYFVKNAWRNHVAHTHDNYSDREALDVLSRTFQFLESLCPRLEEPRQP